MGDEWHIVSVPSDWGRKISERSGPRVIHLMFSFDFNKLVR